MSLATFALVVLAAGDAARAADGRTSSLSWLRMPGADACISTQALARAVEDRLARKVFVSAAEADVSVEGRIEKQKDGRWHASVTLRDAKGEKLGTRDLESETRDASCASMNEPVALVIAVMIDPDAAMRKRPEPPPPPPTPSATAEPPPPAPAPAPPPPPAPEPPRADPWRFEGAGVLTMAGGMTPSTAAGGGVEGMISIPGIPIGLRGYGNVFLPTTASKDGAIANYDLLYVGSALCPTLRGTVNLMACIGGHLGGVRPRAQTRDRGISEDPMPIWNVMLEARIRVPIVAPLAAFGGLGGGIPLLRPTSEFRRTTGETATLYELGSAVFTATLGIGFFFPSES